MLGLAVILVLGCLTAYSALFSAGLARAGAADSLPTISVLVCSLITLVLTFLKSSGVLVGLRDYDMVMSLPVKSSEVVLSRLTMTYLTNFLSVLSLCCLQPLYLQGMQMREWCQRLCFCFRSFLFPLSLR